VRRAVCDVLVTCDVRRATCETGAGCAGPTRKVSAAARQPATGKWKPATEQETTVLRAIVLGLILIGGTAGIGAMASQEEDPRVVEVEQLRDNLFVLRGGGGNTAVFVQADGVTVVDTKNPGWGQPILDAIRRLTDKPVTMIVNTHTHGDHVSGNVEFPQTVQIVAHENTRTNMDRMVSPPGFPQPATPQSTIFQKHEGRGLPGKTFGDRLTLGSGVDRVDLFYFGRAHTNGDAMVVFPSLRVMHMGDVFPGKQIPIMDSNNGGSGIAYADTLRRTHDGVPDIDTIITGHSTQMTRQDLLEYSQFIGEFVASVRAAKKAGRKVEQAAEAWKIPAKYSGYAEPQVTRLRATIQAIYHEDR
jgi:cyclase